MSAHYTDGLNEFIEENYDRELIQEYNVSLHQELIHLVYTPKDTHNSIYVNLPVARFGFALSRLAMHSLDAKSLSEQVGYVVHQLEMACHRSLKEVFTNPIYKTIHSDFKQPELESTKREEFQ